MGILTGAYDRADRQGVARNNEEPGVSHRVVVTAAFVQSSRKMKSTNESGMTWQKYHKMRIFFFFECRIR